MSALDLASLAVGARVQHELMVRSREDKVTKNGDPFAVLQLGNASGQISGERLEGAAPVPRGREGRQRRAGHRRGGELSGSPPAQDHRTAARDRRVRGEHRRVPAARERRCGETLWETVDKWRREIDIDSSCAWRWTCSSPTTRSARGSSARRARRADITRRSAACLCTSWRSGTSRAPRRGRCTVTSIS